ncbi:unnamed protein product [Closterium sp. NIES-65]|nr:unnamed protein product [Closterium sp. NIES-65]
MAKRRSSFPIVRWLLIACAFSFVLVQIRMLMVGTECSDRVKVLMEAQRKWANEARALRKNLTDVTRDAMGLEEELEKAQTAYKQTRQVAMGLEEELEKAQTAYKQTQQGEWRRRPHGFHQCGMDCRCYAGGAGRAGRMRGGGEAKDAVAAVVIMACNRVDYLDRTIQSVLLHHKGADSKFPLFISQDGTNAGVKERAKQAHQFTYLQHIETAPPRMNNPGENIAYYRIAEHYKFALTQLFDRRQFPRVIILEDDMELAPDFFDYFEAASNLLDVDDQQQLANPPSSPSHPCRSILAVSSWNDNGQKQFVHDAHQLYRSDFFPGLGWMLRRELWAELKPKWARAYWDDWLRLPEQRKGRQTIRPEVCRTYNFGEHGSSMGQYFSQYLAPIRLNTEPINWAQKDLSYLLDVSYPSYMLSQLRSARLIPLAAVNTEVVTPSELGYDVMVEYRDEGSFAELAGEFGVFQEWKAGVPRTAYSGVVVFRYHGPHRVFFVEPVPHRRRALRVSAPRAQADNGSSQRSGPRWDPLLADSGTDCPVPEEQQPINEYQSLLESAVFPWVTLDGLNYALRLLGIGVVVSALIGWPIASLTFDPKRDALQCLLGSLGGGQLAVTLAALRLYLGWSYIGNRLFSATVEYEETGWYDGQVWVKTPELLARDRLLASYKVGRVAHTQQISCFFLASLDAQVLVKTTRPELLARDRLLASYKVGRVAHTQQISCFFLASLDAQVLVKTTRPELLARDRLLASYKVGRVAHTQQISCFFLASLDAQVLVKTTRPELLARDRLLASYKVGRVAHTQQITCFFLASLDAQVLVKTTRPELLARDRLLASYKVGRVAHTQQISCFFLASLDAQVLVKTTRPELLARDRLLASYKVGRVAHTQQISCFFLASLDAQVLVKTTRPELLARDRLLASYKVGRVAHTQQISCFFLASLDAQVLVKTTRPELLARDRLLASYKVGRVAHTQQITCFFLASLDAQVLVKTTRPELLARDRLLASYKVGRVAHTQQITCFFLASLDAQVLVKTTRPELLARDRLLASYKVGRVAHTQQISCFFLASLDAQVLVKTTRPELLARDRLLASYKVGRVAHTQQISCFFLASLDAQVLVKTTRPELLARDRLLASYKVGRVAHTQQISCFFLASLDAQVLVKTTRPELLARDRLLASYKVGRVAHTQQITCFFLASLDAQVLVKTTRPELLARDRLLASYKVGRVAHTQQITCFFLASLDAQVLVKTTRPELLARDRLLASYKVGWAAHSR